MKQLYNEMVQYEDEIDKLEAKYNRELVRELTGLNDDNLIDLCLCRFSYYDLIRWTPEQIITKLKINSEYEYYKVLNDDYD